MRNPTWLVAISSVALAACAVNPHVDLSDASASAVSLQSEVPFFEQSDYQCGPAALASVLGASGVPITPAELVPQVYLPKREGSLQVELQAAARRAGRIPYVINSDIRALASEVVAGRPVLVLQNLGTPHFPIWHYAVVVGVDPVGNRMTLYSGTNAELELPAPRFFRTWDWGERWGIITLEPGQLPALPDPQVYSHAVAAFEAVATPSEARRAWRAALDRWPENPRAYFALGNLAYNDGDITGAIRFYTQGLVRDSRDPAISNNLAVVMGEIGCPRKGEELVKSSIHQLDEHSPWLPKLQETLAELAAQSGTDSASCNSL